MSTGSTVGTRALVDNQRALAYINSKLQAGFSGEDYTSIETPELETMLNDVDGRTALQIVSRWRLEHTDAFCLMRDARYANRSRRWLFVKGQQSKLNRAYAMWQQFVTENMDKQALLKKLPTLDTKQLSRMSLTEVLP